jgi:hypothetical protein
MAINVLDLITNGEQRLFIVDASPIVEGLSAALGSEATWVSGSTSKKYLKVGNLDTDWDLMGTAGAAGIVNAGVAGRLALYPASSNQVDDVYVQNSQNIDILVAPQGSRSAAIEYSIPNPGNAITAANFILSEGTSQTINSALIVNGDFTVHGTLTTLDTTNSTLTDKLITLNKGGAAVSAGGSGVEFEENALITGYLKVSADRTAFDLLSPASAYASKLSLANLTTDKTAKLADYSGTFVMRPDATPGVSSQVAYYNGADSIISASGFTYVAGVLTSANMTISALGLGIAHVSAAGVISSSALSLTADVGSSILPIANGGTNSSTALVGKQIMVSNSGATAIVEAGAMLDGQLLIGSTGAQPVIAAIAQGSNAGVTIVNAAGSITLTTVQDIRTSASPVFVGETLTGAGSFFDLNDTTAGMDMKMSMATIPTTNGTLTAIATIATVTDSVMLYEAKVTGLRTGGTAGTVGDSSCYIRTVKVSNIAGTVSIQNLQSDFTAESNAATNCTITVSGTNILVNVKGDTNNNYTWKALLTKII